MTVICDCHKQTTRRNDIMTAQRLQICLSLIFLLLGGWCLLAPGMVIRLTFLPEFSIATDQARFLMGCFGAQAVLTGTLIMTVRFTPMTFLVFGLAGSIPFFVFNYWFVFVEPVLNQWMLLDFAGNLGILITGVWGWRLSTQERPS
ncbi:hypothetical protein Jann_3707 [Jannaschia sp. CCS1]|nr:hypothetical protein Jann_3707 [Jannaschia sp. CCS1]